MPKINIRSRHSFFTLCALVALLGVAHAQSPKSVEEDPEFVEARRLFWSGQYDESEKRFKIYLVGHPKSEASKSFLQMIKQSRIYGPSKIDATRKRLSETHVDRLKFDNAEWKSVTDYFQQLANANRSEKTGNDYLNFINLLPPNYSRKVTLDLRDVSLLRAIEFSCEQAGFHFVVDTWAVIIELPTPKK